MNEWIPVDLDEATDIAKYKSYTPYVGRVLLEKHRLNYEIPGVAGELAFSTWSGLPFGTIHRNADGVDCGDFRFGEWSIDIKTSTHVNPFLLVKQKFIDSPIDIYVLAEYQKGRVKLWGWHWNKFIRRQQIVDYKLGPSFKCTINQLRKMDTLLENIKKHA